MNLNRFLWIIIVFTRIGPITRCQTTGVVLSRCGAQRELWASPELQTLNTPHFDPTGPFSCEWLIKGANGRYLGIVFQWLNLYESTDCVKWESLSSPELPMANYCGPYFERPQPVLTEANNVFITLQSSNASYNLGFSVEYRLVPRTECQESDFLIGNMSQKLDIWAPNTAANWSCLWTARPDDLSCAVDLYIEKFMVPDNIGCLILYDGQLLTDWVERYRICQPVMDRHVSGKFNTSWCLLAKVTQPVSLVELKVDFKLVCDSSTMHKISALFVYPLMLLFTLTYGMIFEE